MEIVAAAINSLGSIIGGIAIGAGIIFSGCIVAGTILVYNEIVSLEELKEFLKKEDKKKWR